jgi:hypothetical protein
MIGPCLDKSEFERVVACAASPRTQRNERIDFSLDPDQRQPLLRNHNSYGRILHRGALAAYGGVIRARRFPSPHQALPLSHKVLFG